jgi:hypothetical protein
MPNISMPANAPDAATPQDKLVGTNIPEFWTEIAVATGFIVGGTGVTIWRDNKNKRLFIYTLGDDKPDLADKRHDWRKCTSIKSHRKPETDKASGGMTNDLRGKVQEALRSAASWAHGYTWKPVSVWQRIDNDIHELICVETNEGSPNKKQPGRWMKVCTLKPFICSK